MLGLPVTVKNLALLDRLDRIVLDRDGRFYLAKGSRMSAATLRVSDSRATDFHAWREDQGLARRFRSAQADRLEL